MATDLGPILLGTDGFVLLGADGRPLRGAIGSGGTPITWASYLLLIPHYLHGGLTPAGTIVTEESEIPVGWIPTLACDPQNAQAIQYFWTVGPPRSAEYSQEFYPFVMFQKPAVYWQPLGPAGYYQLTGAGASLGAKANA